MYALNLAVGDTIKQSQSWCEALETALEISKLITFPPRETLPLIKSRQKLLKSLGVVLVLGYCALPGGLPMVIR